MAVRPCGTPSARLLLLEALGPTLPLAPNVEASEADWVLFGFFLLGTGVQCREKDKIGAFAESSRTLNRRWRRSRTRRNAASSIRSLASGHWSIWWTHRCNCVTSRIASIIALSSRWSCRLDHGTRVPANHCSLNSTRNYSSCRSRSRRYHYRNRSRPWCSYSAWSDSYTRVSAR